MKKKIQVTTMLVLVLAMLAGCGKSAPAKEAKEPETENSEAVSEAEDWVIGYTTYSDAEESCLEFQQGILDCAEKYGVKTVTFNSNADPAAQTTGIEDFIAQNVDAMCIGAVDSDAIVPAVDQARAAGIKVVNFDIVANTEVDGQVGVDNGALAAMCAEYLAEALEYQGKVLVMEVPPSVVSIAERCKAEIEVFKKYENMEVVTVMTSNPDRNSEMTDVENALMANPDIVGIVGVDTDTTMAALLACEAQKMTNVKIAGPNLVNETREIIANGDRQIIAMADARNYDIGYQAMETTIKLLQGENVEPVLLTEFEMKDAEACKAELGK